MVNQKPRSKGFTNDEEYLQLVGPDVVFVFYGYNESFAGSEGAEAYQKELVKFVNRYKKLRKAAGKSVRFVLFSPIAAQNTGDPLLSDGVALNKNLAAYTEATQKAASETEATFVDLYTPTKRLFQTSVKRYTLNGIHLNALGYKKLAGFVSEALLGKSMPAEDSLGSLYATVKDKNWH